MAEGEFPIAIAVTEDYSGHILFFYDNGKVAKVPMKSFETKLNRKKLANAYCAKAELVRAVVVLQDREFAVYSNGGRMLLVNTALVPVKQAKDTLGVQVMTLKKNGKVEKVVEADGLELADPHRYRTRNLPAAGAILREEDIAEQTSLL